MDPGRSERRLAAIMFTDIVGYTTLMAESEERGLEARERHTAVVRPLVERYHGRWVEETGDESLSMFESAVAAVNCALAVQAELRDDDVLRVRIGIHLGETLVRDGQLYGDGVNVASRVRPLAKPGGVCVSDDVEHSIRNQSNLRLQPMGEHSLKNVSRKVSVFSVEGSAAEPTRSRPRSKKRLVLAAAVAAFFVAALALSIPSRVDRVSVPASPMLRADATSIVVLPFADMSAGGDKEYLSDGLTEEIIHTLAQVDGLQVVSRTSAFAFKGEKTDVRAIGTRLGVGTVLEGSVRQSGDRLRVTAQLIDTQSGYHRWSESYDRRVQDVFGMQEEIARSIARTLEVQLASSQIRRRAPTVHFRAFELTLQGRAQARLRTLEALERAAELFERAIEVDPGYAAAYAGLSNAYHNMIWLRKDDAAELSQRAAVTARRAVELDPESARAQWALAAALDRPGSGQTEPARAAFRRALLLARDGDSDLLEEYAAYIGGRGHIEQALEAIERALVVDPLSPVVNRQVGRWNLYNGNVDRAIQFLWRSLELNPLEPIAPSLLWIAYELKGMDVEARESLLLHVPGWLRPPARALARLLGLKRGMALVLPFVELYMGERCTPYPAVVAQVLAYVGDADRMFECLGKAAGFSVGYPLVNPLYAPYRDDPRFREILRKLDLLNVA